MGCQPIKNTKEVDMWWNKEHIEGKTEKQLKNTKSIIWNEIINTIEKKDIKKATEWIELFKEIDKFHLM